ncbi:winged helix-turn-helix domain-containing protein [Novosphingobium sp. G106]|nr:winged helix-turn-helix domain-containing protein [Novosphingobium sp. G106]
MLPRYRTIGPLRLDLFARDGFVAGRPLALHPREFALLWRLADRPGMAVSKQALLSEVWRLYHVPDTNSLAVHVFRLRAKLAGAGLEGYVRTVDAGGYMLAGPAESHQPAIPMLVGEPRLADLVVTEAETVSHEP